MGFYVKDLYIQRVPKFVWHDKLTNPPTVPETSPIISVAALSPQVIAGSRLGGGGTALPADDGTPIPTWISPIATGGFAINEADLAVVRERLAVTLQVVDAQIERMQPSGAELEYATKVLNG